MPGEGGVARKGLHKRSGQLSVAAVVVAAWVFIVGGCGGTSLPPKLTPSQRESLAAAQFHTITVGVERFRHPVYSERLTAALGATHLFAHVDAVDAFDSPPTFVARVERPIYGTAVMPWTTALSLGLIPTTVDEEHGYSFSLSRTTEPTPKIPIEFSYHGTSTLGWLAAFLNLFKDGAAADVYRHPRLVEHLTWTIVEQGERICQQASGCHGTPSP